MICVFLGSFVTFCPLFYYKNVTNLGNIQYLHLHFFNIEQCFLESCRAECSLDTSPPISTLESRKGNWKEWAGVVLPTDYSNHLLNQIGTGGGQIIVLMDIIRKVI